MTIHTANLQLLLQQDRHARHYFDTLPSYVQDLIRRGDTPIHSQDELRRCADRMIYRLSR